MFSGVLKDVNGSSSSVSVSPSIDSLNKRSTVCDADANGKVNVNCRR